MSFDLTFLWGLILAFAVFAYVVLDGFDLGIGILFPLFPAGEGRNRAMNSIAPVWDGNETWLILGGGGLLAAFPLAYAVLMPAIYAPVIAMLLGLVFRGVAFEFRWRTKRGAAWWDRGFFAGSTLAAFCQGVILGAILQGVKVEGRAYAGGWWDWLSPFSLLTGASVVAGYALLGSAWLVMKTEGELQSRVRRYTGWCAAATLAAIVAVSLATPFLKADYYQRWFAWPGVLWTAQIPVLVAITAILLFWMLRRKAEVWPFLLSLALFAFSFIGLGVSFYPYIVPESITLAEAAAPESSQIFMLIGAAILLPVVLAYTAHAYWIFRGKTGDEGYH
ncbi:MAG: cytochrome d ubiquinol oxidase subunit II [Alphaproteobacteria bacterium]|nr:cytochrome d ubiquinol oxidase subunit II [Alphaproteobacteria bacterium]